MGLLEESNQLWDQIRAEEAEVLAHQQKVGSLHTQLQGLKTSHRFCVDTTLFLFVQSPGKGYLYIWYPSSSPTRWIKFCEFDTNGVALSDGHPTYEKLKAIEIASKLFAEVQ